MKKQSNKDTTWKAQKQNVISDLFKAKRCTLSGECGLPQRRGAPKVLGSGVYRWLRIFKGLGVWT